MAATKLIADCGATKSEWRLLGQAKEKTIFTQGISPYFLQSKEITSILQQELLPGIKNHSVDEVYYYGTGCASKENIQLVKKVLKQSFPAADISVNHDLMAAARALCGHQKGIACILGTGSNSGYYNGEKMVKNSPGLGYVLGDEGSGAYLGKKVVQYYLYNTFDEELKGRFEQTFSLGAAAILDSVYKKPLPNRYLAQFAMFLTENRNHYMVENIIEDGLNDFFFTHLCKYTEVWKYPVNFVGSIAFGFKDVLKTLCSSYEFELGTIVKAPMDGLAAYHK